jgi:hypothetical protein
VPAARRHEPWSLAVLVSSALALGASDVRAQPRKDVDTADGPKACREFAARNERELEEWQKQQPPVPYEYPRDETLLHAPWPGLLSPIGSRAALILATILPHAGAQLRGDTPAAVVSWPWSLPLGPVFTCSRKQGTFTVDEHRAHRAVLEPGFVSSTRGVGLFVRPGYRFLHHPSEWVVGVGGGLGTTVEVAGNREPFRPSISPEALLRFGNCCEPSYFTLAFRYDHFFAGEVTDTLTATLGYVYF